MQAETERKQAVHCVGGLVERHERRDARDQSIANNTTPKKESRKIDLLLGGFCFWVRVLALGLLLLGVRTLSKRAAGGSALSRRSHRLRRASIVWGACVCVGGAHPSRRRRDGGLRRGDPRICFSITGHRWLQPGRPTRPAWSDPVHRTRRRLPIIAHSPSLILILA